MKIHVGTECQFLKQADKESGGPEEEEGVQGPLKGEKNNFFFYIPCLSHIFFFFNIRTNDYTTKQFIFLKGMFWLKLCTNDYITTMFPALGNFFSSTF